MSKDSELSPDLICVQGYHHKDAGAKGRCFACSSPEVFEMQPGDVEMVRALRDAGYLSISNKHLLVARVDVPEFDDAVAFYPGTPAWLQEDLRKVYEQRRQFEWLHSSFPIDKKKLTIAQYHEFKRQGRT